MKTAPNESSGRSYYQHSDSQGVGGSPAFKVKRFCLLSLFEGAIGGPTLAEQAPFM